MDAAPVVAALVATVYALLALLHVFWAAGGRWGAAVAVPERDGAPLFRPSRRATLLVAAALGVAALVVLAIGGVWAAPPVPPLTVRIAAFTLGAIFVLRAVGDFRLIGFFKRTRGTAFARKDSWLFSPLALLLGASVLWLASRSPPASPPSAARVELVPAPMVDDVAGWVRAEVARRPGRAVLVYEGAAWCEPCNRFHEAARAGRLDATFPTLSLLELDADLDGARLGAAGYASSLIPLFALPGPDGRASGAQIEGGVKGDGAVDELVERLRPLVERAQRAMASQ